jgi:hypothetical protein
MSDAIQQIIDRLRIDDVAMLRSQYWIAEKYLATQPDQIRIRLQLRSQYERCDLDELQVPGDAGSEKIRRYRFVYQLGVRVLQDPDDERDTEADDTIISVVEAQMYALYLETNGGDAAPLGRLVLDEFGHANGLYHVWPYWREYVHSAFSRLRMPTITIPMFRPPEKHWGNSSTDSQRSQ